MKYFVLILVLLQTSNMVSGYVTMKDFTANGEKVTLEVSEGDNVFLSCDAEGHPQPVIYLTRHKTGENLQVVTTNNYLLVKYTTKVTANLIMKCEDTGMYSCLFGGEGKTTVQKYITVSVKCTPILISSEEITKKFDITTGADLEFDINIYGYPAPTQYTVTQREDRLGRYVNKIISGQDRYSVTYTKGDGADGQVVLKMIGMKDSDSGKYVLRIDNGIGLGLDYTFDVIVDSAYKQVVECNSIQSVNSGSSSNPSMNVVLTCSISKVDHPPNCHFRYKLHSQFGHEEPVQTIYVDDKPPKMTGNPPYYEKVCTMTVPVTSLQPLSYEFKALMYPSGLDHSLGKSMESLFKLDLTTPSCDKPFVSDDHQTVSVSCQTTGVYPQVVCSFKHSKNKKGYKDSDGIVTTNPPHCPVKQTSCFYHCSLTANIGNLGKGSYTFKVRMMPILRQGLNNVPGIESGPSPSIDLETSPYNGTGFTRMVKEDEGVSDNTFIGIVVGCGLLMLIVGIAIGILVGKMRKRRNDTPAMTAILDRSQDYCELAPPRPPRSPQGPDSLQRRYTYEMPVEVKHLGAEGGDYNSGFDGDEKGDYSSYIGLEAGALPQ